jgi:ferredoxin-NADP reductase
MPSPDPYRPVSAIDIAAACAANILPRSWRLRIDRTRLDAQSVVDSLRGIHEAPFRTSEIGPRVPVPLASIDPLEHILPRPVSARYVSVRRDLDYFSMQLRGRHPPPFWSRQARQRRQEHAGTSMPLRVEHVDHPTGDAVVVEFRVPPGHMHRFLPGQFVTLHLRVGGVEHRRAYSICSTPDALPSLRIAVRRVEGGTVSTYLHDHVRPGDTIEANGPSGSFTEMPTPGQRRRFLMLAAGSGITPMMSLIPALLQGEPDTDVELVYGNRSEGSILFRESIEQLVGAHPSRFRVHHVLSRPSDGWRGRKGWVDPEFVASLIDAKRNGEAPTDFMLCGPEAMMQALAEMLEGRGVPPSRIRRERFVTPRQTSPRPDVPQRGVYRIHGTSREVIIPAGKTLLQAGVEAGLPLRSSCAMGGCAACKVKLHRGAVHMDEPNALTAREREDGYVLACIAYATEPVEVVSE